MSDVVIILQCEGVTESERRQIYTTFEAHGLELDGLGRLAGPSHMGGTAQRILDEARKIVEDNSTAGTVTSIAVRRDSQTAADGPNSETLKTRLL